MKNRRAIVLEPLEKEGNKVAMMGVVAILLRFDHIFKVEIVLKDISRYPIYQFKNQYLLHRLSNFLNQFLGFELS